MLFNSIDFFFFLPVVFILYWFVFNKTIRIQNFFILVASYVFYGWWDWRFLLLIFISSLVDFWVGIQLSKEDARKSGRKALFVLSLLVNLGLLGFFKYYNFFIESFVDGFSFLGMSFHAPRLNLILPVGISFYTFQTISYTVDIYRGRFSATKDPISFFAFVAFFPQLVAGPVEKARNLLPQLMKKRVFQLDQATDGLRQMLWGLFMKVVIADNCARYVDFAFGYNEELRGSTLILGAILFSIQAYGDFAGYSHIAIGTARLFGVKLMTNFNYPFFSLSPISFWQKWHISLASWFKDYIYIPLGGNRSGTIIQIRNIFIIFLVSGIWHGANWTFIIWGILNAVFFIPYVLLKYDLFSQDIVSPHSYEISLKSMFFMALTFIQFTFGLIFFRSESFSHAVKYLEGIADTDFLTIPELLPIKLLTLIGLFFVIEWMQRGRPHALNFSSKNMPVIVRWGAYIILSFLVSTYFSNNPEQFIYFQF